MQVLLGNRIRLPVASRRAQSPVPGSFEQDRPIGYRQVDGRGALLSSSVDDPGVFVPQRVEGIAQGKRAPANQVREKPVVERELWRKSPRFRQPRKQGADARADDVPK